MKHLKYFNSINEEISIDKIFRRISSKLNKFIRPEELDKDIKLIFNYIRNNFNINNLTYGAEYSRTRTWTKMTYVYNTDLGDTIKVNTGGIRINDIKVDKVNKSYVSDLLDFFKEKYMENDNKERESKERESKNNSTRVRDILGKYKQKRDISKWIPGTSKNMPLKKAP